MNNRDSIQDELKALDSQLPDSAERAPFSLPDGYFEGFAASVMARIKGEQELSAADEIQQLSPLLAGISRTMPFSLPDHYFSDNLDSLYAVVAEEPVSTLLSAGSKTTPYSLPEGYFEGLSAQITGRIEEKKPVGGRVVSMRPRMMRWAVAAIMIGIVAISGIAYFNSNGSKKPDSIPVDNPQWVATKLQNVSPKDIDEFVRSADATASTQAAPKNTEAKPVEVKKMLHGVSDKELDEFLAQVPSEDEELAIN